MFIQVKVNGRPLRINSSNVTYAYEIISDNVFDKGLSVYFKTEENDSIFIIDDDAVKEGFLFRKALHESLSSVISLISDEEFYISINLDNVVYVLVSDIVTIFFATEHNDNLTLNLVDSGLLIKEFSKKSSVIKLHTCDDIDATDIYLNKHYISFTTEHKDGDVDIFLATKENDSIRLSKNEVDLEKDLFAYL